MSTRSTRSAGVVTVTPWYWLWRWCVRHRRWLTLWALVAGPAWLTEGLRGAGTVMGLAIFPGVVAMVWVQCSPASYSRLVDGPARRLRWRWYVGRHWQGLCRSCGLSQRLESRVRPDGRRSRADRWVSPRLCRVRTRGHVVRLTVRARPGQTVEEVEAAAPRLAATMAAESYRTRPVSGSTVVIELVMRDVLAIEAVADAPEPDAGPGSDAAAGVGLVRLGRTQDGGAWSLQVTGRHTLVAGCSGAGKGSVLWGICAGLAPAVHADRVRLWGIDLKRGVELATGAGLFSARAYTPTEALGLLRELLGVIDARGHDMVGRSRLHQPVPGDPLHVLVIDELAALTAYAEPDLRREANRLLAEILTQGRALGVVVLACVQDPRKEVVSTRGLFTQTIALRLRSVEETTMVLGEGMAKTAPAHRISPIQQGVAWVVEDTGAVDRVRADFWPDDLIRSVADRYRTQVGFEPAPNGPVDASMTPTAPADHFAADPDVGAGTGRTRRPRSPRTHRQRAKTGGETA